MNRVQATNSPRALYNDLRSQDIYRGKTITPGYLRLEVSLQSGALNQLNFTVLENVSSQNVTEKRLKISDRFVMDRMFFGVFAAGTTTTATQAQIAISTLSSFPNSTIFSTAGEAASLMNYYNGNAQIRVNDKVYVDSMDLMRFYRVSTSQKGAGPAVVIPSDEWNDSDYGFDRLTPTVTFDGGSANYVQVNMPAAVSMVGTGHQNFAVMIARGFLIQNGSTRGVSQ